MSRRAQARRYWGAMDRAGGITRRDANFKSYHQMVLAGVPASHIQLAFDEGEIAWLQEDIMKAYWKMVRELLRKAPVFQRKLDFMSSFYERGVEELLDAIATAHFPQITVAATQPGHQFLRSWINELYHAANEQLEGALPVRPDEEELWAGIDQPPYHHY